MWDKVRRSDRVIGIEIVVIIISSDRIVQWEVITRTSSTNIDWVAIDVLQQQNSIDGRVAVKGEQYLE